MHARSCVFALLVACGSSSTVKPPPPQPDAGVGPLGGRMIATNQGDHTLSVLDPATGKGVGPLLVPVVEPKNMEMPHELSTDPAGRFLVFGLMEMPASFEGTFSRESELAMMSSTLPGYLLKLAPDGSLAGKIAVEEDPGDNALSLDGNTAFVSHFDLPKITVAERRGDTDPRDMDSNFWAIDTATMTQVGKIPICPAAHVIELSADGRTAFVTCLPDEVAMIDVSSPAAMTVTRIQETPGTVEDPTSPANTPFALQTNPKDDSVWVSNLTSRTIMILDPARKAFDQEHILSLAGIPIFTTFNAAGSIAYTAHQQPDGIAVYDTATRTQTGDLPLSEPACLNAHQIWLSADEKLGYVLCEGDHTTAGQYTIIDLTQGGKVVRTSPLGIYPVEMAVLPNASGG